MPAPGAAGDQHRLSDPDLQRVADSQRLERGEAKQSVHLSTAPLELLVTWDFEVVKETSQTYLESQKLEV